MIRRINILVMVLITFFTINILMGCAGDINIAGEQNNEKLNIVCTTFPQYDWVSELIKGNEENITLTLLMDKGGDLHNFQPSVLDIAKVADSDIFIYVGGESDRWVDDVINETSDYNMRVINMMESIEDNAIEEEASESIAGIKAHNHEHDEHDEHEYDYDEHVWLSLRNSELIVEKIADELSDIDSGNSDLYAKNCEIYLQKLQILDERFEKAVKNGKFDTILFADRFPFRYFVEDYGIKYYAAFEGCSAETEASFETVAFLVNKLDETGVETVFIIDGSNDRLAKVIIENSQKGNQKISVFNSLQSISKNDIENGVSYLSVMEQNLEVLSQALQ